MGKSQHLAQIRSLGLLHDLQEYIASVETLAAEQKRELDKVREEKRDMEKYLARAEAANQERMGPSTLDFSVSEVSDLPPRLRALVEDNRGLRELVRRYKGRLGSLEHHVSQQQSQILALAEANEKLKQSLAECSRTPAEVEREDTLKKHLDLKTRQVENLEHGLGVLRAKVETDAKLYRQGLSSAAREKDVLKRQLVAANKTIEDKDKELRGLNIELRKARRGVPPTRGGGPYQTPGAGGADDFEGGSNAGAAAAAAAAPPAPPPEPEERIRIMLIIVRDEIQVPVHIQVPVPVPVPMPLVEDAPGTPLEGSPDAVGREAGGCDPGDLAERLQAHQDQEPAPEGQPEGEASQEEGQEPPGASDGAEAPPETTEQQQPAEEAEAPAAAEDGPAPEPSEAAPAEDAAEAAPEEAAPEPDGEEAAEPAGEPETEQGPAEPEAEQPAEAAPEPELDAAEAEAPAEASLEAEPPADAVPATEEASEGPAPLESEPSASGLMELEAAQPETVEAGPLGETDEEAGKRSELDGTGEAYGAAAAAAPLDGGDGGGEAADPADPDPPPEEPAAPPPAELPPAADAAPLSHSSPPMPVPYARTTARALANKVGGASTKQPHPPAAPHGTGGTSMAHRKHAAAHGGPGALHGVSANHALKGPGGMSRRQPAAS